MLEGILQEIEGMGFPFEEAAQGLDGEGITDRYMAAAYGFAMARGKAVEALQGHRADRGWTYCGDGRNLPEEGRKVLVQYCGEYGGYVFTNAYSLARYRGKNGWWLVEHPAWSGADVLAWTEAPECFHGRQKAVGDGYKQQIMDRFLRVE